MARDHKSLRILLIEPFFSGSHRQWAEGLKKYSRHHIDLATLPGRHWKWRMHGAAVTFAEKLKDKINDYDLVLATDMLDIATFRGLSPVKVPVIAYFHENQLAYPWSATDPDTQLKRDRRYMWINLTSAMAADQVWFNSIYNQRSFTTNIKQFLKAFPDHHNFNIDNLVQKSRVVPLGLELTDLISTEKIVQNKVPVFLWNHRWEYDKNPELFFNTLMTLKEKGLDFQVCVLGEHTHKYPPIFDVAREKLAERLLHFGPVKSRKEYIQWVSKCDILPVTNNQDFFGISVVEAIAAGVTPILPRGLAYEEYVEEHKYEELYYSSAQQLLEKCSNLLTIKNSFQSEMDVSNYDWKQMIDLYDCLFTSAVVCKDED